MQSYDELSNHYKIRTKLKPKPQINVNELGTIPKIEQKDCAEKSA